MEVLLNAEDGRSLRETDVLDPHWLTIRRVERPDAWPWIGRAGQGWTFCTIAQTGELVCPLTLAIESGRTALILPMVEAMALQEAGSIVRLQAGQIVETCIRRMGPLDANHRDYMTGLVALLARGAILPAGLSELTGNLISFMAMPRAGNASIGLGGSPAPSGPAGLAPLEMQIDATLRTSFLASLLLAAECAHGSGAAFCEVIRQDRVAALTHREPEGSSFAGAGVLHLCVHADRPAELVAALDSLGHGATFALDGEGWTALELAASQGQSPCEHALLAHHARHAAQCALLSMGLQDDLAAA